MHKTATDGFSTQPHSSNSALSLVQSLFRTWALWISDCGSNSSRGGERDAAKWGQHSCAGAAGRLRGFEALRRHLTILARSSHYAQLTQSSVISQVSFVTTLTPSPKATPNPGISVPLSKPHQPTLRSSALSEQRELAGNRPISTHDRLMLAAHPMGVKWAETDLSINQRPENTPSWHLDAAPSPHVDDAPSHELWGSRRRGGYKA